MLPAPPGWFSFTLSAAFVITGLGKRIAYILIGKIGSTTLGLGYVTAFWI
jgi:DASS family divalent anion:Na+ symporter